MNLRAIKEHLERWFNSQYQNSFPDDRFTVIRYLITTQTKSPARYFDLIRVMSALFNVRVIRNEHSIDEGLYIMGRTRLCEKFKNMLQTIIYQVETKTFDWSMTRDKKSEIHGATEKSKFKGKLIIKFELMIKGIEKNYAAYARIRHIEEHERMDQVSFVNYMKSFPHLKTKTPLRWH